MAEADTDLFLDSPTGLPEDMLLPAQDEEELNFATSVVELPPVNIDLSHILDQLETVQFEIGETVISLSTKFLQIFNLRDNMPELEKLFNSEGFDFSNWLTTFLNNLKGLPKNTLLDEDSQKNVVSKVMTGIRWHAFEPTTRQIPNISTLGGQAKKPSDEKKEQ